MPGTNSAYAEFYKSGTSSLARLRREYERALVEHRVLVLPEVHVREARLALVGVVLEVREPVRLVAVGAAGRRRHALVAALIGQLRREILVGRENVRPLVGVEEVEGAHHRIAVLSLAPALLLGRHALDRVADVLLGALR